MEQAGRAGLGIDTAAANIARMYDYWLGGKDNLAADREAADRQVRAVPQLPRLAGQNRDFLRRAVAFCVGEGITQFLDIGSGLPTNQNVHEVAQRADPGARVVYVDIDPMVVIHAKALLSGSRTAAIRGDVCRPDDILGAPEVRRLVEANEALAPIPARTREEIAGFFGGLTLVEPGLTDIWAWRPDAGTAPTSSDFMRILGGVARKD